MMAEIIDRKQVKRDVKQMLTDAQVSPKAMVALYLGIVVVLNLLDNSTSTIGVLSTFINIFTSLLALVLCAGFVLYCMAIRRGERAEFLTLFDGFSFVGKVILLHIIMYFFVFLWTMLFIIPGFIALYRYRFALYNLCENPGIGAMEALEMSKRQTYGYKMQLFMLDLSYMGWILLASLPSGIYVYYTTRAILEEQLSAVGIGTLSTLASSISLESAFPMWGFVLIVGLWNLLVGLFYLPVQQCVDLSYFETAKSTSGISSNATPKQDL